MKKQIDSMLKKAMWIAVILFVIRAAISWGTIQAGANAYVLFGYAGEAIGIAAILLFCYEKWLWKYDPLVNIPYIDGYYNGIIKSNYDGKRRNASLRIKQTLISVDVSLKTDESNSRSVSGSIEVVLDEPELIYTYLNEPKAESREKNSIHYGTATFCVEENKQLVGKYYTDRGHSGDMVFTKVDSNDGRKI